MAECRKVSLIGSSHMLIIVAYVLSALMEHSSFILRLIEVGIRSRAYHIVVCQAAETYGNPSWI